MNFWGFLYNYFSKFRNVCAPIAQRLLDFNSKRFWNKNINPGTVFGIMVSRSLDVSLHFNENLTISSFLYIFWKIVKINANRLLQRVWTFFFKSISKLLQFGTGFWSFLDVSEHFNKSAHFLIIRNRYNPFKPVVLHVLIYNVSIILERRMIVGEIYGI